MKWSIVPSGSETDPCCCEPDPESCCMYPISELGVSFTEDDLPESVRVTIPAWVEVRPLNQFRGTGILNKDVDGSQLYVSGDVFEYREHSGESWVPVSAVISNYIGELYELTVGGDSFGTSQSECLFWKDGTGSGDGNLTPEDDLVEDQFADCYQVDLPDEQGTATVYRQSLCVWSGNASNPCGQQVLLFYCPNSGGFGEDTEGCSPHKWSLSFAHFIVEGCQPNDALIIGKSGNQNSPVGNYPATFYDDTVVSECET
jgi:hypothetical protein